MKGHPLVNKELKKTSEKMAKACQETVKACQGLSEALGKLQRNENPKKVNQMTYNTLNGEMI